MGTACLPAGRLLQFFLLFPIAYLYRIYPIAYVVAQMKEMFFLELRADRYTIDQKALLFKPETQQLFKKILERMRKECDLTEHVLDIAEKLCGTKGLPTAKPVTLPQEGFAATAV